MSWDIYCLYSSSLSLCERSEGATLGENCLYLQFLFSCTAVLTNFKIKILLALIRMILIHDTIDKVTPMIWKQKLYPCSLAVREAREHQRRKVRSAATAATKETGARGRLREFKANIAYCLPA